MNRTSPLNHHLETTTIQPYVEEISKAKPTSIMFESPIEPLNYVCSRDGLDVDTFNVEELQSVFENALQIIRGYYLDPKSAKSHYEGFKMKVFAYDADGKNPVYESRVLFIPVRSPWEGKSP